MYVAIFSRATVLRNAFFLFLQISFSENRIFKYGNRIRYDRFVYIRIGLRQRHILVHQSLAQRRSILHS